MDASTPIPPDDNDNDIDIVMSESDASASHASFPSTTGTLAVHAGNLTFFTFPFFSCLSLLCFCSLASDFEASFICFSFYLVVGLHVMDGYDLSSLWFVLISKRFIWANFCRAIKVGK